MLLLCLLFLVGGCASLAEGSVLTFPAGIDSIGEEAFMNDLSVTAIELPEELSSIGPRAFAGCAGLISLTIPDSVTLIGEDAFDGCVDLTLLVNSGSYAEQYCIDHELRYQLIDAEPYEPESSFNTCLKSMLPSPMVRWASLSPSLSWMWTLAMRSPKVSTISSIWLMVLA